MKNKLISLLLVGVMVFGSTNVAFAEDGTADQTTVSTVAAESQEKQEASGKQALSAKEGGTGILIDVRAKANYEKYHVEGTVSYPLFDANGVVAADSELASAFTSYVKDNADLTGKDIYLICNSGKKGAALGTDLLLKAGYTNDKIYTVTNGIKDLDLLDAAIGNGGDTWNNEYKNFVSGKDAVAATENENIVILDVRAAEVQKMNGRLKNSVSLPLFGYKDGQNVAPNLTNDLAKAFVTSVTGNKDFAEKEIYILCNGGQSGARAALKLLLHAGYNYDNIHVIKGGAGDADVKAALVVDNQFTTGADALNAMNAGTGVLIDVRTEANYNKYHVEGTVNYPLFDANGVVAADSELANAFTEYVTENKEAFAGKSIYLICNSGKKGAALGTDLLRKAGYDNKNIFSVTNGIKDLDLLDKAIGDKWSESYNSFVTGADAVKAIGSKEITIIDLRNGSKLEANGYLSGSIHLPLFDADGKAQIRGELADNFTKYVSSDETKGNINKTIYLLCNGGQSGARAGLKLLLHAGYNYDNIKVIKDGAKDADVQAAFIFDQAYVTGSDALKAVKEGTGILLDVRAEANYKKYHVNGSLSAPLFAPDGSISQTSDLAKAFTDFVTENKDLKGKDIYIICNSGKRGAETATALLRKANYASSNIFTITNGIKDIHLLNEAIGNDKANWDANYPNFVSGKDALEAMKKDNTVVLDVRAAKVREAHGYLKNSISLPLFNYVDGKNVGTNLNDDLSKAFLEYVTAHKTELAGKEIYILCNSGQSGARAALKLLLNAGFNYDNIHVIKGGVGDAAIKAALINVGIPQTGDSAPVMTYALLMGAAALTMVAAFNKKKFAK